MAESTLFVIVKKMHANTRICFKNADIGVHSFGFFAGEEDPREVVSSDQLGLTVVELRENDCSPARTFSQELSYLPATVLR